MNMLRYLKKKKSFHKDSIQVTDNMCIINILYK